MMRLRCVALVAACVLSAPLASGQSKSAAQSEYDWGLAEMQAGRYASGCPALAASYKLDPLPGALFTLAECERQWGKLATALAHYAAYLDAFSRMTARQKADQVGRDQLASAERDRLERDAPRLTIALGASAPRDTTVLCDGEPIGAPSLGVALPVDPGEHVIAAEASDGRRFEEHFTLARGDKETHVVELKSNPAPVFPTLAPSSTLPEPPSPVPTPRGSRTWIYASGAIGIAGVTVGAVAGVLTIADKATIDQHCGKDGNPVSCDSTGKSAADASRVTGLVSDVAFGVGAAGLATALVLWILRPPSGAGSRTPSPVVVVGRSNTFLAGIRAAW
jgi:hypothetical protein